MSDFAITPASASPPGGDPATAAPAPRRPRGFLRTAIGETFAHTSARIGLAWIAFVVFIAIFSPLLASSYPIVMKDEKGVISSPMLQALDYADITLLILFFTCVIAVVVRRL